MPVSFECPYCGETFKEADDIEYVRSYKTCPECDATFDEDEIEEMLPAEEDVAEGEEAATPGEGVEGAFDDEADDEFDDDLDDADDDEDEDEDEEEDDEEEDDEDDDDDDDGGGAGEDD